MVTHRVADAEPRLMTRTAVAGCCAGFVVLGALQAFYGPAIPAIRARFGVTPPVAGLGLSAQFAGALLGVVAFQLLRARVSDRMLLGASYALMAAGAVLFAISPSWPAALGASLVSGLGGGGIDYGLNRLFAVGFGRRGGAMLNLLNAYFGVGAVVAPALVGWVGANRYPWLFGAAAVASLLLIPSLGGIRREDLAPGGGAPEPAPGARAGWIVAAFVTIYVLYVAIETGVGGWEPTQLGAVGYSASVAATATSVFWLALTVGRFVAVPVSLRWPGPAIVIGCCLGMVVFLGAAAIPAAAPYAYAGLGLACAPIWPTGLPWLSRSAPSVAAASAYVMGASMVGGIAFPPLLGRAIEVAGVRSVPLVLGGLAVICAVLSLWLRKATGPGGPAAPHRLRDDRHRAMPAAKQPVPERPEQPVRKAGGRPDDDHVGAGLPGDLPELAQRVAAAHDEAGTGSPRAGIIIDLLPDLVFHIGLRLHFGGDDPGVDPAGHCDGGTQRRADVDADQFGVLTARQPGRVGQGPQRRRRAVDADDDRTGAVGAELDVTAWRYAHGRPGIAIGVPPGRVPALLVVGPPWLHAGHDATALLCWFAMIPRSAGRAAARAARSCSGSASRSARSARDRAASRSRITFSPGPVRQTVTTRRSAPPPWRRTQPSRSMPITSADIVG
jgi:fucose permease